MSVAGSPSFRLSRLLAAAAACALGVTALTGCTSTSSTPSTSSMPPSHVSSRATASTSAQDPAPAPRDADFVAIGTAVVSGPDDSVTTTYEVGRAGSRAERSVPATLLAACGWTAPAVADSTVFVHGRMTVTYRGGVDQDVVLEGNEVTSLADPQSAPRIGHAVVDATGGFASTSRDGWSLCDESADDQWARAMAPGQTVSLEMWLGVPNLAGATTDDLLVRALAISFAPVAADDIRSPTAKLTLTGRGAATCRSAGGATNTLLLFDTPPATYAGGGATGHVTCGRFGT